MTDHRTYRALTLLYPKEFRHDYRDDLIQLHADLASHRGTTAAWTRSVLDLLVTVPRYRLEAIMNPRRSTTTLNLTITVLAFAGIASLLAGLYPGVFILDIGNDDHWGARAFLYNAIFYASTIAAMAYLVAGLLTPKNRGGLNLEPAS